jgi:D-alanine-D-alanine ligase
MTLDKKILICYNEPIKYYNNYLGKEIHEEHQDIDLSERDFLKQIDNIQKILQKKYFTVDTLPINRNIQQAIKKITNYSPDAILNFVESVEGNSNLESYFTGLYDLLNIPFTGNNSTCLGNCLVKERTKQILHSHGVRTPKHVIAEINKVPKENKFILKYPVILKLATEDASIGISEFSVVNNYESLKERLNYLFTSFNQNVIIEEYIDGRELNVAILGNEILPISEIIFDGLPDDLPKIITYEAKWSPESIYYKNTSGRCPAQLDKKIKKRIEKIALTSFHALECRDYARVDIRLSTKNVPYVIEINPNPDISPDSGFVRSANAAGISYEQLINKILTFALQRAHYDTQIAI